MADFKRKFRLVNRIDELIKTLEDVSDEDHVGDILEEAAAESSAEFFPFLKAIAPEGEIEPGTNQSAGERLHGITIAKGWNVPEVVRTPKGVHMRFSNRAPQVRLQISGAIGHNIPGRALPYPLKFWWGRPLRWPAKDGYGNGMRSYWGISHPGFPPNNFPRKAWERVSGKKAVQKKFQEAVTEVYEPLRDFFNKK